MEQSLILPGLKFTKAWDVPLGENGVTVTARIFTQWTRRRYQSGNGQKRHLRACGNRPNFDARFEI